MEQPEREELTKDDRTWGMLCHISTFSGYVIPLATIIAPLVIWLVKKDESPFVDHHGREALNFQISVLLYLLVSLPLAFFCIGLLFLLVIPVVDIALTIVAAIKANDGVYYRYPLTIRFL